MADPAERNGGEESAVPLPKLVECLRDYTAGTFVADVIAGLTVGLVAFKLPIAENGPVAAAMALVEFDEELPIHSVSTNARVFEAAEHAFRKAHHLASSDIAIRESFVTQSADEVIQDAPPTDIWAEARVWLTPG